MFKVRSKMKSTCMNYIKPVFKLIFFINLVLYLGCAAHKPSVIEKVPEADQKLARKIRGSILSNDDKLRTLKTNAVIKVKSPDFRVPVKLRGILRFRRPNTLRLVASKFTFTIFDMIYNSNQLSFYVPQERKVFLGFFDASTEIQVTGLTFKPYDVLNIFNFKELFQDNEYYLETDKELWIMHIYDQNHNPKHLLADLYINKYYNVIGYDLFDDKGKTKTSVSLDEFAELDSCHIPHKIMIKWPQNKTSLALSFSNPVINQILPDEMFAFQAPQNASIIPIASMY